MQIVLFGSTGCPQCARRPVESAFVPKYAVKTVKYGGASVII